MRILDRYLIRESIGPFLLALAVFTFVLDVRPMLDYVQLLLAKGVPIPTVGFLVLTLLPQALGITLPMAFLTGLLMGFGRLSGDRETVALLACGVNPLRLLRPTLLMALVAGGFTMYVMIELIPDANQKYREITARYLLETAESDIKPQMFYEGFPGKVIYVRATQPGGGWDGVFLADTSKPGQISVAMAEHGRLVLDKVAQIVNIVLDQTINYMPSSEPGVFTVGEARGDSLQVDPKEVFRDGTTGISRGLNEMTIADLVKQWHDKVNVQHLSPHGEIMTIHQKFSFPVACLVFALVAVPLGFHTRKEGKLGGMTMGLAVIVLYWGCMQLAYAGAVANSHWFNPHWARWFPNIVIGAIGIVAVWWRVKATGESLSLKLPWWLTKRFASKEAAAATVAGAPSRGRTVVVLTFVGLMVLYYIGTVVDLSDKLFKGHATGLMIVQFMYYSTPRFIYYVIPIATLVAVLGTIGGLTRSSELIVMRACGVSLYRAALPLMVLAVLSGGLLFVLEEHVLPDWNKRADELENAIHDRPQHTVNIANRSWLVGENDHIYYYNRFDPQRAELHELNVFETATNPYRLVRQTYARAAICPDRVCTDGRWKANAGWVQQFVRADRTVRTPFVNHPVALDPVMVFTLAQVDASMMTFGELRDYINRSRASGFNIAEEEVNLQSKISVPAVTLVMTLLAIPFAVTTGRRGALYGIGLAIVLSVAYWLLMAFFLAAGKAGLLPPPLAAWATSILFMAVAIYLVLTVRT